MGHAVHPGGDDGSVQARFQVTLFDRVGDGGVRCQQEPGSHRHPGRPVGQCRGQAPAVEETTRRDHRDSRPRQHVEDRRQKQCGGDGSGVAAAFPALDDHRVGSPGRHLAGVLGGTHRRNDHRTGILESGDEFRFGRQCEGRDFDAFADHQLHPIGRVGGVGSDVDAEGAVGGRLHLRDRRGQFVDGHGGRSEDAQSAGVGGRRHQPCPGDPAHTGLDHRMLDADQPGQRSPDSRPARCHSLISPSRRDFGSIRRISSSSGPLGRRVAGASSTP